MNSEIVATFLASLGGATIIVGALSHFLGKVWADRIAKQTLAKYDQELEVIKSKNNIALESFRKKAEAELKDREHFGGISKDVYEDFFKKRVLTYESLLSWKNDHIRNMHEDFLTEELEIWGDSYYLLYLSLRNILIKNQLYVSNELARCFHEFRLKAAEYTKEGDMAQGYAMGAGASEMEADEERAPINDKFVRETHELMDSVITQLDSDISKLRSRIEIDKA